MAQSAPPPPPRAPAHPIESDAERRTRAVAEEEAVRDKAEAAASNLPSPGSPFTGPLTPAQAAVEGEATVMMNIPAGGILLTLSGDRLHTQVYFPAGVQAVPVSLAEEDYLALSGATPLVAGRA